MEGIKFTKMQLKMLKSSVSFCIWGKPCDGSSFSGCGERILVVQVAPLNSHRRQKPEDLQTLRKASTKLKD